MTGPQPYAGVRGAGRADVRGVRAVVAAEGRGAGGRAQRPGHPHRRPRLRGPRLLRLARSPRRTSTRLAARGVRYTNFHVTPMCSPTRAALLTGLNRHRAGVGHVAHSRPRLPRLRHGADRGRRHRRRRSTGTRAGPRSWSASGTWPRTPTLNAAGAQHSWPCQRGFDRFYGILDGFTNLHQPHRLMRTTTLVEVDRYPDGYYLTDDLTDRCHRHDRKELRASHPRKPFFTYLAHGAVPRPAARQGRATSSATGAAYDGGLGRRPGRALRPPAGAGDRRPEGTELAPRNTEAGNDVRPWDELTDHEKALFARHMEVYAGMVDSLDQNVGPAARRPGRAGRAGQHASSCSPPTTARPARARRPAPAATTSTSSASPTSTPTCARLDLLGGPQTMPALPPGLGHGVATRRSGSTRSTPTPGGHSVPFVVSWPDAPGRPGASCGASTPTSPTCCPRCWT